MKRIFLIPLMFSFFFVVFTSIEAGAQNSKAISDIYIFVQIFVRDSDGNLVTYLETDSVNLNREALNAVLDFEAKGNDPIYELIGKKFQLIQISHVTQIDSFELRASTKFFDTQDPTEQILARFAHDGYFLTPGDEHTLVWSFFREVS